MSTDRIFGSWNDPPQTDYCDELTDLWGRLATQNQGTPKEVVNSGLTQRRAEITMLWTLYKRARPRVVLEIGTAQGGTFAGWCLLGRPDATIISIDRCVNDCLPRPGESVHPLIAPNVPHKMTCEGGGTYSLGRHQQKISAINGWSYEPETLRQLNEVLAGRKIDWLWHDASHQPENFAKDWKIFWPMVADGGVFCSHDICPCADPNSNKSIEWERIKREEDYAAIYEFRGARDCDSMGIGVLFKP